MIKEKRPSILTYICYGRIVNTVFSLFLIFSPTIKRLGDFVPMGLGILLTLQFISVIGILHMKRWGVNLFVIVATAKLIFQLSLGIFSVNQILSLIFSIIYLIIFLFHYKKMDSNL